MWFLTVALFYRLPLLLLLFLLYGCMSPFCRNTPHKKRLATLLCRLCLWATPTQGIQALRFGRLLGDISRMLGAHKHTITTNLNIAFAHTHSATERTQLVHKTYRFIGACLVDWLAFRRINAQQLRALIAFEADAECTQFIQDASQQGCILLGVHSANLYCTYIIDDMLRAQLHKCVYAFAREQPPLGEALKDIMLDKIALQIVMKQHNKAARLIKTIKQGQVVYLTPDVDVAGAEVFHPFFSEHASVAPGIYRFAQRQQCPVYMCACYLDTDNLYKVRLQKVHYDINASDTQVRQQIVGGYFAAIEQLVREHPEQYQWMHKRWRTRPAGDERTLYKQQ